VKTKTDVDIYLIKISMDFLLHVSSYDLGHHQVLCIIYRIKKLKKRPRSNKRTVEP
jgi:hypothetical protein